MFDTIDQMRHYIRTAAGDSTTFYPSDIYSVRLHGILQGNGAGPFIWALVSTPILDRMRDKGHGVTLTHQESGTTFQVAAFSFVDNADFPQALKVPTQPALEAQQNLNEWTDSSTVQEGMSPVRKAVGMLFFILGIMILGILLPYPMHLVTFIRLYITAPAKSFKDLNVGKRLRH
jgi:hypothetical protein